MSEFNALRGKRIKDPITGLEGICTSISEMLSGTIQAAITPMGNGTEVKDAHFIDIQLLEVLDDGISAKSTPADDTVTVKLGDRVVDRITGYDGVALGKDTFINGCVYFTVQGKMDTEGKRLDPLFADHARLVTVTPVVTQEKSKPAKQPGGPMRKTMSRC